MKRILVLLSCFLFLSGCGSQNGTDRAMTLRQKLLACSGCSFDVTVTADYSDVIYTFAMQCEVKENEDLSFTVKEPESISGITGIITGEEGQLTFDSTVLAFSKLADGQITPVSAPWVFIHTLRSGYIRSCSETQDGAMLIIDDSYEEDPLQLDIWLNGQDVPVSAEILWQGRRIVSLEIENFTVV